MKREYRLASFVFIVTLVLSGCATEYEAPPKRARILMDCQTKKCLCEFPAQVETNEKIGEKVCRVPTQAKPKRKPCSSNNQFFPFFPFAGLYGPYGQCPW